MYNMQKYFKNNAHPGLTEDSSGMAISKLLHLPFGNQTARCDMSLNALYDAIAPVLRSGFDFSRLGGEGSHMQRSSVAKVGKLTLAAVSGTSLVHFRRAETQDITLRFATLGSCKHRVGRRLMEDRAGESAVFHSGAAREGENLTPYGCVMTTLDKTTLASTVAAMLGMQDRFDASALCLDEDREVALKFAGISFDPILRKYFALIESMEQQPGALALMGLDDAFYRSFAMMLQPKLFFDTEHAGADQERDTLDLVCGYIQSRLDQPITLTELEQLSGLSTRGLQYAFKHRFQCTPMQWIRYERLALARARLAAAVPGTTVLAVALSCGFGNPGIFTRYYRQSFGELPSDTLGRALKP